MKKIITLDFAGTLIKTEITKEAKKIFVTWGHPKGGKEDAADHTINAAEKILNIIK